MNVPPTAEVRFKAEQVPYSETGFFSDIVLDYLSQKEHLRPFYNRFPAPAAFAEQAANKAREYTHREPLVAALKEQYRAAGIKCAALDELSAPNAFTVTTGHQVCLFTGPVYFIYKIATAIATCRHLSAQHTHLKFVPVFWMATEDHDFAEANHFYLPGAKVEWESAQAGAVGRMSTVGLDQLADTLKETLGVGYHAAELLQLFEKAYVKHPTIAAATRYLVHHLFGSQGVVCVDGDDPALKALVAPLFRKELFDSIAHSAVEATSVALSAHYAVQAHPRPINLFYLDEQLRERIVRRDDGSFEVLHTDLHFTAEEMEELLLSHPERFSPNVILRPLYQEAILPNLAYIGGGGELAYWFQLKGMFEAFGVVYPIVMLRNSALVADAGAVALMDSLRLGVRALFQPLTSLEVALVKRESDHDLQLTEARERLQALFTDVEEQMRMVDTTLATSARSGYARSLRVIEALEKKLLRAERKQQEVVVGRLHKLHEALFPKGGLQERRLNFSAFYLPYGKKFIESLPSLFDPFGNHFAVLIAEDETSLSEKKQ